MISRRQVVLALGSGALTAPLASFAQQPSKFIKIGFLGVGVAEAPEFEDRLRALRAGLADLGYVEGKTIVIEYRWAEGKYDRLDTLAQELVRSQVAVIVTHTPPGVRAAKRATSTIPIVIAATGDAVVAGLVPNLARPGGNVTGLSFFGPEVTAKRLELLRETLPKIQRVGVLFNPQSNYMAIDSKTVATVAQSLKVHIEQFGVKDREEFATAFAAMNKGRIDAIVVTDELVMTTNATLIADLAKKHRLPVIGAVALPAAGGLLGYGTNLVEMFRRSATYVDKILKGAKPGDLPIEQPTKFELVVNFNTAKALGAKIPQSVLQRADRVIE